MSSLSKFLNWTSLSMDVKSSKLLADIVEAQSTVQRREYLETLFDHLDSMFSVHEQYLTTK